MLDRGHINEISSRQRNVRRDARAFSCDRFFSDLNKYLLSLAKQIGDSRLRRAITTITTVIASTSWAALISAAAWTAIASARRPYLRGQIDRYDLTGPVRRRCFV